MRTLSSALLLSWIAVTTLALAQDPPVPPGGFPVVMAADTEILTYSDGYRTFFDLRVPDHPAPATGWPLILVVHGGGGNKNTYAGTATGFAASGYAALTYDFRGQGSSMNLLNLPTAYGKTRDGLREIFDLFELLEGVEAAYPAEIDFGRLGVTGFSQGGNATWNAAVHSGTNPPVNPWGRVAPFPQILAAVPQGCTGPARGTAGVQTAFSVKTVEGVFSPGGIHYDPTTQAGMEAAVLAEDYLAYQALTSSGAFDEQLLLSQTQVPVYFYASYDDPRLRTTSGVQSWELLTSTKRMQLGTGHHGCPNNTRDSELFRVNRRRWFDRYLKSEMNGVENGPAVVAATTPENVATYNSLSSRWDFRRMASLDAGVTSEMLFLTAPGLQGTPPGGASAQTVVHTPPPFMDMSWWTANLPSYAQTLAAIPLSFAEWDSVPATMDRHLIGQVQAQLQILSNQSEYQLNVVVLDVAPSGSSRMITKRDFAVRANTPGVPTTLNLEMDVQSYVLRAGHRVRLRFENLARRDTAFPGGDRLERLPVFSPFSVDIVSTPANPSWINIPLLPFADPVLSMHPILQDVDDLEDQTFTIHTDSSKAGWTYVVAGSASGSSPGFDYAGVHVPLNIDPITNLMLMNPNVPPFIETLGTLDAQGSASIAVLMPPSAPFLSGLSLHFVGAVISPLGDLSVTEAEEVRF